MLIQLILGSFVICGTVIIQVFFLDSANKYLIHIDNWLKRPPQRPKLIYVLVILVIWLVAGLTVSAWLWALVFYVIEALPNFETALYFAIVTFSTLGYGDIVLNNEWRILAGLSAVNGLIIVGLNTAFLADGISKIYKSHSGNKRV